MHPSALSYHRQVKGRRLFQYRPALTLVPRNRSNQAPYLNCGPAPVRAGRQAYGDTN